MVNITGFLRTKRTPSLAAAQYDLACMIVCDFHLIGVYFSVFQLKINKKEVENKKRRN